MGPRYPPPTLSRLKPLGADSGGPRSVGCSRWTSSREPWACPQWSQGRRAEAQRGRLGRVACVRDRGLESPNGHRQLPRSHPVRPRDPAALPTLAGFRFLGPVRRSRGSRPLATTVTEFQALAKELARNGITVSRLDDQDRLLSAPFHDNVTHIPW